MTEEVMIKEYGKHYLIYSDGRVFSKITNRFFSTKRTNGNGYVYFSYRQDGCKTRNVYFHRVVAECFVDNPNKNKEVNHIDGNKSNNHFKNLEWCNRSYNTKHAYIIGVKKIIMDKCHKASKEANKKPISDKYGNIYSSLTDASKKYGICISAVCAMLKGVNFNKHGFSYLKKIKL